MAWIWIAMAVSAVGFFSLWVISLWRIVSSSSPSCLPSRPPFLSAGPGGGTGRNVLLVVAHPDDESMFFTPTILFLKSKGHNMHILCMSQGNADDLGNIRKEELYWACATLKIPVEQVKILDHPNLQDGFDEKWDHGLLADLTRNQIQRWNINSIITFDSCGISGHPNHRDVHYGMCKLIHESVQGNIEAWELVSTNILRKYSGPVDIWLSSLCSSSCSKKLTYSLLNSSPGRSYQAMAAHESQWVWFRRLFVLFSSYTYINTLRKI